MLKKFFAMFLIGSLIFPVGGNAEEIASSDETAQTELEKANAEAARNKELLEIWKEHVRTLTRERDEAIQHAENLKTGVTMPQPTTRTAAYFGEIETQPLPTMAFQAKSISAPAPVINPEVIQNDIRGYQETIKGLRTQLQEIQEQKNRLERESSEASNDKTRIIRDKEDALSRLEASTKEIQTLKEQNEKLTKLSQATPPAAAPTPVSKPSDPFLQNAFNTQSKRLQVALAEKEQTIRLSNELQKKYVDLQTAYDKIKAEKEAKISAPISTPTAPSQNLFEVNHLKSQNTKLKTELETLRAQLQAQQEKKNPKSDPDLAPRLQSISRRYAQLKNQVQDLQESAQKQSESETALSNQWAQERAGLEEEIASLRSAQENTKLMSVQLSSMRDVKNELEKKNQKLSAEIIDLKNFEERLRQDRADLLSQMDALKTHSDKAQELQAQLEVITADKENLSQKTQEMEAKLTELETQKTSVQSELDEARNSQASTAGQLESLKQEILTERNAREEAAKKSTELQNIIDSIRAENAQISPLQEKLRLAESEALRVGELEAAQTQLRKDLEEVRAQNEILKKENTKISQYETEKKYLQNIYSELTYKAKLNQEALNQALEKNQALQTQNQELLSKEQSYQAAEKSALQKLEAIEGEKQVLISENKSYQTQIEQMRSERDAIEERNQSSRSEINQLNRKISQEKEAKEEILKQLEGFRSQTTQFEAEKSKWTAENETMKKAMVDLEREAQANEDRVDGLKQQISDRDTTIESLRAELKKSLEDIQNLKNNFQSYLESLVTSFEDRQKKGAPSVLQN